MTSKPTVRGVVFIGRENELVWKIQEFDPVTRASTDMVWSGVTRMVLFLLNSALEKVAVVDTDEDASLIDYATDGEITLKLGDITDLEGDAMTAQVCKVRLTAYEGANDTEIIHEATHDATIQFVETSAA